MAETFTPGPWEMWTSNSWRRIRTINGSVCEPITQSDGHPDLLFQNGGPDGPDARLMLAAPDLYEALTDLLALFDEVAPGYAESTIAFAARAALAKVSPQAEADQ